MKFLVTGAAGFIGYHVSGRLLANGHQVIGLDNLSDYDDLSLKQSRLDQLVAYDTFTFYKQDLVDRQGISDLFVREQFERVIHLGGQAGVRYSLEHPLAYANANLIGHLNILEGCRHHHIDHLLYASSSAVYGLNQKLPFSTEDSVDHPVSLYAATKKANELMAHTYAHLYQLPTTGLRFFTVYGPWGRSDMALFKFTKAMFDGERIDVYNQGEMQRDFTYIDDVTETIIRLQEVIPVADASWNIETGSLAASSSPYRIYNVGNSQPIKLMDYIQALEQALGMIAKKNLLPMQPGEILQTSANTDGLYQVIGFKPNTPIIEGVNRFVDWYRSYYQR